MKGHIRRRGKNSWELKFDTGIDPSTGRRRSRYHSFKGSKRDAQLELAKLITANAKGEYVDPSKVSLGEFLDCWERDWAVGNTSPKTLERYTELLRNHVRPFIGARPIQKLTAVDLTSLYARLLKEGKIGGGGLSPRTVGHVHRVLHRALGHAAQWRLALQNVAALVDPPKVEQAEIQILRPDQIKAAMNAHRGKALYPIAAVALGTGMRRGELLALRWCDVDLDRATVQVQRSLEVTRKGGLRFKPPKTKYGRRSVAISPSLVALLRGHWKAQQEQRLLLGLGKAPAEALVFATCEGKTRSPNGLTKEWSVAMARIGLPEITLHALRHTHASQLIASGIDVLTISRRLGHGSPAITLAVYGHLFSNSDAGAAQVVEDMFAGIGTE